VRIAIPALGTRGDVQPYVALAAGLHRAGHEVVVTTHEAFAPLVRRHGLEFQALPGDPATMFEAVAWDPLRISPWRPLTQLRIIRTGIGSLVDQVRPDALAAGWADVDLVLFGSTTTFGHFVAQQLGVPSILTALTPAVATSAFPHPVLAPRLRLGGWGSYASWLVGERLARQTFQEPLRPRARRECGLPGAPRPRPPSAAGSWPPVPVLHAFSPWLVPRPRDWAAHVEVTGWWTGSPSPDELPEDVERFLSAGDPPLFIGFGSMPLPQPERVAEIIVGALRRTGQRALICGLRGDALRRAGTLVHVADDLPHDRVFERVAAVVHHGGSGTVGTGLRAGRPTLVVPFVYDQFFWGRRVELAGVGPRPVPFAALSADRLAAALTRLADGDVRAAAQRLGERIRQEDGVTRAVGVIEQAMA
jgi:UDP:flavonoid glycosyltransferase YjiC (YdhE family)